MLFTHIKTPDYAKIIAISTSEDLRELVFETVNSAEKLCFFTHWYKS